MRVIAVIEKQDVIEKILHYVGLPTVPIPFAPAKGQQRLDFDFAC